MKLWAWLYTLIWTTALQIILGFYAAESLQTPVLVAHAAIGVAVLVVAQYAARAIRKTEAPDRLKRVARVSGIFAGIQFVLGLVLFIGFEFSVTIPGSDVLSFFHLLFALAILAQAASVATAYDMWEEKEFAGGGGPQKPL
jgi:hypothetical protein